MTTSWKHPHSGETVTREAIEALVKTYRSSPREHQRRMAWDQLHRFGVQLDEIIRDFERRLERGDELLTKSPDDAKEDRWLGWLAEYESACDALSLITYRVVEDRPDFVSTRKVNGHERVAS